MYDVVSIGSGLVDLFLHLHDANEYVQFDRKNHQISFSAGEKIPLESSQFEPGGNACNAAVGFARLGLHSALMAEFGDDAFSRIIRKRLEEEGVSLEHIIRSDAASSFSISLMFQKERTLFSQHVIRAHNFSYDSLRTKWVYLTSLGEHWKHVYREVPAFIKKTGYKLAFNPGSRQLDVGRESIESVLQVTDILFVNKEEGQKISNYKLLISNENNKEAMKQLLFELQKLGPKKVIVTDGDKGGYVLDEYDNFIHQPIIHAPVVEKTGAGDSFASGFLGAVLYGENIETAMKWGVINSASVIGKVGAQAGLLTKQEINKRKSNS